LRWPVVAGVLGTAMVVGAAVFGYVNVSSVGTGDLDTAAFGETVEFAPSGSYRASIYTTRGLDVAPVCEVTDSSGAPLTLRDATPYTVNTHYDMEAAFGFDLGEGGSNYRVGCGEVGQDGSFAVVEISPTAQRFAIAVGVVGVVVVAAGIVGALVHRRRATRESQ